ncbi:hypothetical protein V6574_02605 [Streptomyces sp. SM1P]
MNIRKTAAATLLHAGAPASVPHLLRALGRDDNPGLRTALTRALGAVVGDARTATLLAAAEAAGDERTRRLLLSALDGEVTARAVLALDAGASPVVPALWPSSRTAVYALPTGPAPWRTWRNRWPGTVCRCRRTPRAGPRPVPTRMWRLCCGPAGTRRSPCASPAGPHPRRRRTSAKSRRHGPCWTTGSTWPPGPTRPDSAAAWCGAPCACARGRGPPTRWPCSPGTPVRSPTRSAPPRARERRPGSSERRES